MAVILQKRRRREGRRKKGRRRSDPGAGRVEPDSQKLSGAEPTCRDWDCTHKVAFRNLLEGNAVESHSSTQNTVVFWTQRSPLESALVSGGEVAVYLQGPHKFKTWLREGRAYRLQ